MRQLKAKKKRTRKDQGRYKGTGEGGEKKLDSMHVGALHIHRDRETKTETPREREREREKEKDKERETKKAINR